MIDVFACFNLPIYIYNRSARLVSVEAWLVVRSCYRMTAVFFSPKSVPPCYTFCKSLQILLLPLPPGGRRSAVTGLVWQHRSVNMPSVGCVSVFIVSQITKKGCWEHSCLWVLRGQNLLQCEVYRDSMLAGNSHRFQGIWSLGKWPRLTEVIPSCFGLLECAHSPCLCSPAPTMDYRAALCDRDLWQMATLLVVFHSPLVQRIVKSLLQSRSGTFCGYVTNRDEWVRKTFDCRQTAEADGVNPDVCGATWKLSLVQHRLCV